jgi:hypothetical protein
LNIITKKCRGIPVLNVHNAFKDHIYSERGILEVLHNY